MATPRGYTELSSADAADIEQVNVSLNDIDTDVSNVETAADATAAALTALDTDVEYAYSTWKPLERWQGFVSAPSAGVVYVAGQSAAVMQAHSAIDAFHAEYIDPADLDAGSRAVKVRASVRWRTNSVAPTQAFDVALYEVTGYDSTTSTPRIATIGAAQGGATQSAPTATTSGTLKSTAVTISSAGVYVIGITVGGSFAANARIAMRLMLDYQQS